MSDDSIFLDVLKQNWGYDSFRGIQLDIIRDIHAGRDVLGLMPTGGGKSITFQVPALLGKGLCLVISPLISLMKDQVEHLRERSIRAAAIYSGMDLRDIQTVLYNAAYGAYELLYISPERLTSEPFLKVLRHLQLSFVVVDEAHCISQWGYDFRPSYLNITSVREVHPSVPILALTATATPRVVDDICYRLGFRDNSVVHRMSFARDNLAYVVRKTEDKLTELLHILRSVSGSAVVYVRNRQQTREVAKLLRDNGMSAHFYHAGINNADRDVRQLAWKSGETRVMVATNAFGMGIDKPDVRLVVHLDLPDSLEAYFQEAGRAGRDGQKAYAVLLHNSRDSQTLLRRIADAFPPLDTIRRVYASLAYYYEVAQGSGFGLTREFQIDDFCRAYKFFPTIVLSALKILTRAGYIYYRENDDATSRLTFISSRERLYGYNFTEIEEQIIEALMRNHTGLFSDYVPVDEAAIARAAGVRQEYVYPTLKGLTHQRIIHYIPRRLVPRITFTTRRLPESELVFTPEVYADRRRDFEERIGAMVAYANSADQCRSRVLLAYFGETESKDCGQCDVCLAHRHDNVSDAALRERLLQLFADGKWHSPASLKLSNVPTESLKQMLQRLSDEGLLQFSGRGFRLNKAGK